MKHLKKYDLDNFSQYSEYQKMVNLVYDAKESVFIVKPNGIINLKYWFDKLDKKRIEFIYKRLHNFDYEIYAGAAIEIFNIQPSFFKELKKEYDEKYTINKYNL